MLRGSIWYPNSLRSIVFLTVVTLMIVLHQSQFLGLTDSTTLVFGWLPMQLAYDVAFNLVGVVVLYGMYRAAPEPPETHEPTRE
ncbi:hypothetical protein ACFQE1_04585 [Halobium palmae]|uniref:Uncharacterized protein n=1 Tax=Halobium palmae TaxID=1776492 RepID=A0ABD5RXC3_9EURY